MKTLILVVVSAFIVTANVFAEETGTTCAAIVGSDAASRGHVVVKTDNNPPARPEMPAPEAPASIQR